MFTHVLTVSETPLLIHCQFLALDLWPCTWETSMLRQSMSPALFSTPNFRDRFSLIFPGWLCAGLELMKRLAYTSSTHWVSPAHICVSIWYCFPSIQRKSLATSSHILAVLTLSTIAENLILFHPAPKCWGNGTHQHPWLSHSAGDLTQGFTPARQML